MGFLPALGAMAEKVAIWFNTATASQVAGAFLVMGALIAFAGAVFNAALTARTTSKTQARSLFVGTVTTERAQWRQDLREAVSDLVRLSHLVITNKGAPDDAAKLEGVRAAVRLRLNPSEGEEHEKDQEILRALANLALAIKAGEGTRALEHLETIESGSQRLLKQEWQKSKTEARTGRVYSSHRDDKSPKLKKRPADFAALGRQGTGVANSRPDSAQPELPNHDLT